MILTGKQVKYRGTVTGLKISSVDGTAFIDNLPYTYQSDFSAGVDGFTAPGGAVAGNIDSIGLEDNTLRFTSDNLNSAHYATKTVYVVGKRYKVTFKYYIPSGQSNIDSINMAATYWGGSAETLTVADTWTTVTRTFVAQSTFFRLSAADGGTAVFQDAGGDDVFYIKDVTISEIQPYMDGNHQIEIYDASNRMLRGVLKAAGTGETLGDELSPNVTMESLPIGWIDSAGATATRVEDERTGGAGTYSLEVNTTEQYNYVVKPISGFSNQLIKYSIYAKKGTANAFFRPLNLTFSASAWTLYSGYGTVEGINNLSIGGLVGTSRYDDVSVKQVLTPSSSGATIVSAKGGDVYNFSYKNASFKYNAASYYCIVSKVR